VIGAFELPEEIDDRIQGSPVASKLTADLPIQNAHHDDDRTSEGDGDERIDKVRAFSGIQPSHPITAYSRRQEPHDQTPKFLRSPPWFEAVRQCRGAC